jgi:hypothetical protein
MNRFTASLNAITIPGIGRVQRAGLNHCYRAVRLFRSSRQFRIMEKGDGTPARVRIGPMPRRRTGRQNSR